MPGRVTSFFRNTSGNIARIKKATVNRSRHASPDVSDTEDSDHHRHHHHHYAFKMPDLADALKSHRRLSLPFGKQDSHPSAVSLSWNIESPPIIFHGTANESTGALVSGTMILEVKEDIVELDSLNAALNIHVTHKRPYQNHCPECANQYTELQTWIFLAYPTNLYRGRHLFPFSTLLDGHLPDSALACDKHSAGAQQIQAGDDDESPKRGIARSEVRLLGEKNLHEGWKSDYSGTDGTVDMEFDCMVNQRCRKGQLKYAADSKWRDGTEITHSLLIELVMSKEFAPEGRTYQAARTGIGRTLRMHFVIVLTEHPGLGVSWDEEAPPIYQDVPPSPPEYQLPEPPIEYEDLEFLDARLLSTESPSRRASRSE